MTSRPRTVRPRPGLEEASAPENRSSRRTNEEVKSDGLHDAPTSPVFWYASANAVEAATDLSEPSTFEAAVSGPDQVHWRKAICTELESMRLRGVFRATKLPNDNVLSIPSGYSRSSARQMGPSRSTRHVSWPRVSNNSTVSTTLRRFRPW